MTKCKQLTPLPFKGLKIHDNFFVCTIWCTIKQQKVESQSSLRQELRCNRVSVCGHNQLHPA